ncbi:hypothetical protein PoB_003526100 [Plakobranchus ocellatus]|uniref:Uncharacterized protein n=1 Tax=Plakobranchus ocellatus TaxID=259542 RepID=A0AAV4AC87_9GAST|nr:hypothetical protein PoB_003526100 [Plakobranchus ocellatus]
MKENLRDHRFESEEGIIFVTRKLLDSWTKTTTSPPLSAGYGDFKNALTMAFVTIKSLITVQAEIRVQGGHSCKDYTRCIMHTLHSFPILYIE